MSNLQKSTKPSEILNMAEQNRTKLVVPPNLLKQENVCVIPREAEHPSIIRSQHNTQQS